jgi:uncharacterized protein (TIGR02996 family)
MTEREALLRTVCENPDDDTPRLVFADWLDENGEAERAEFIRLQILMAQMKDNANDDWPGWQRLCARELHLLHEHDEQWWRELPEAAGYRLGRIFSRGFIGVLFVTDWYAFVRDAESIFASAPLTGATFSGFVSLATPSGLSYLSRLRHLNLCRAELSEADLGLLADDVTLPRLTTLSVMPPKDRELRMRLVTRFGRQVHDCYL